jgi:hypothetical protein
VLILLPLNGCTNWCDAWRRFHHAQRGGRERTFTALISFASKNPRFLVFSSCGKTTVFPAPFVFESLARNLSLFHSNKFLAVYLRKYSNSVEAKFVTRARPWRGVGRKRPRWLAFGRVGNYDFKFLVLLLIPRILVLNFSNV